MVVMRVKTQQENGTATTADQRQPDVPAYNEAPTPSGARTAVDGMPPGPLLDVSGGLAWLSRLARKSQAKTPRPPR